MLKPKFQPPAATWLRMPPARQPGELFETYVQRRAIQNHMRDRINAQAPGRAFQFKHGGLAKRPSIRANRGGYGANLMRHYDELNFEAWKRAQGRRTFNWGLRILERAYRDGSVA